jgi:DNA-binding response OmpR family regulator
MRHAQVIVCEPDLRLGDLLRECTAKHGWRLRHVRDASSVVGLLRGGAASVVVLKTGRDLEREFATLERISRLFPETATVVVGDADHPALAALAWDLGARYVLFAPLPRELLPEIVTFLMTGSQRHA